MWGPVRGKRAGLRRVQVNSELVSPESPGERLCGPDVSRELVNTAPPSPLIKVAHQSHKSCCDFDE